MSHQAPRLRLLFGPHPYWSVLSARGERRIDWVEPPPIGAVVSSGELEGRIEAIGGDGIIYACMVSVSLQRIGYLACWPEQLNFGGHDFNKSPQSEGVDEN